MKEGKHEFSLGPIQFAIPEGRSTGNKSVGYAGLKITRSLSVANDIKGWSSVYSQSIHEKGMGRNFRGKS